MILSAIFRAKEGKRAELLSELHAVAIESRKEAGVKFYLVNEIEDQPNSFMNIEVYESEETFEIHLKTPHVVGILGRLDDLLETPLVAYKGNELFDSEGPKSAL